MQEFLNGGAERSLGRSQGPIHNKGPAATGEYTRAVFAVGECATLPSRKRDDRAWRDARICIPWPALLRHATSVVPHAPHIRDCAVLSIVFFPHSAMQRFRYREADGWSRWPRVHAWG